MKVSFVKVCVFFFLCCLTNFVSDFWYSYAATNIKTEATLSQFDNDDDGSKIRFEEKLTQVPIGFIMITIIGGFMFYKDIKKGINNDV